MRLIIPFLIALLSLGTSAQERVPFCGFDPKTGFYSKQRKYEYITHKAKSNDKSGIPEVVKEITNALQMDADITVYIAKQENNCFATILEGNRRVIIADHLFLNAVNKESGTEWAAISILAHEVGHHIAGFGRNASQLDDELDADYWSGYVLNKLGAARTASTKCIMRYGTDADTNSHPNRYRRAKTIEKGWDDAAKGQIDYTHCEDCEK